MEEIIEENKTKENILIEQETSISEQEEIDDLKAKEEEISEFKGLIKTSSELKQLWKYCGAPFLSQDGKPYDYIYAHQFIIGCLGDKTIRSKFIDEVEKLEQDNIGFTKEMMFRAINCFSDEYYKNSFLFDIIRKLDEKYSSDKKQDKITGEKDEIVQKDIVRKTIFDVTNELNLNMPVINYYIMMAVTIIISNTDLIKEEVPHENILNPKQTIYGSVRRKDIMNPM